jgi:prepilin-type N-terminal cleavage/methylation domain-containing protein
LGTSITHNRRGFTAIELIVSIGILSVVGVALVSILVQAMQCWSAGTGSDFAISQSTLALQKLTTDIRDARMAATEDSNQRLVVTFPAKLHDSSNDIYDASATDPVHNYYYISEGNLVRRIGTATSVIGTGITEAQFDVQGESVIVRLKGYERVGKVEKEHWAEGRVAMRNFQE